MFRKWVTFADVIVTSHCRRQHAPVQTRYHTSNRPWHRVRDASKLIFCIWREIEYIVLYIKNDVCVFSHSLPICSVSIISEQAS